MSDHVLMSVCYNGDETFVDMLEIPYNTVWNDLEAMFVARLDSSRVAVSYTDTENDEISIGSQEELFEAFRMAMKTKDQLMVKVLPLSTQTPVFRMPDMEDTDEQVVPATRDIPTPQVIDRTDGVELTEPLDLREICPDHHVAIPMPDVEHDKDDTEDTHILPGTSETRILLGTSVDPTKDEPIQQNIVFPDINEQLVVDPNGCQWESLEQTSVGKKEQSSDDQTDKSDHLLQYSDFVTFMTKLKRDLRTEIVRDVTRKTVKHVLKGLDGAVIESLQGSSLLQGGAATTTTAGSSKSQGSEHPVYVHDGVYCDGCSCVIVGARYKCGNCLDFDYCESCEDKPNSHNPDHVFVKIRRPCFRAGVYEGVRKPLLKSSLYRAQRKCGTKLLVPIYPEGEEFLNEVNVKLESKMIGKMTQKEEKKRIKSEKKIEKLKRKEEKLKRRIEAFSESPMKRERLEILDDDNTVRYDFYKVMMSSLFLTDISIPENTKMQPETKFLKTWKMKNDGDGPWSSSTKLKLQWGNIPTPSAEVDVPCLKPGEEGNVSVDFVSPTQPGEYQSHWKLHENGMPFGVRIWCSILVQPKETLEPSTEQTDSLKVVMESSQKSEKDEKEPNADNVLQEEEVTHERVEITFRSTESEEHLREVFVKHEAEEKPGTDVEKAAADAGYQAIAEDSGIDREVKDDGSQDGTDDGFVVYAKHGDDEEDVTEIEKDRSKEAEQTLSIAEDLSSAVARLTLEGEKREVKPAVSYTNTPNNTPFDVTPLKTPNPEPEEDNTVEEEDEDQYDMRPISNSSSVELVASPDNDEINDEPLSTFVKQRMESLELKPDIDLESVSSYSDDDDDSVISDSDYIIVPLPDCFDLTKPLKDMTLSSYSNSCVDHLDDDHFSLDDNHNSMIQSERSSRAVSVDEILTTSSSLPARPLSPTQVGDSVPYQSNVDEHTLEAAPTCMMYPHTPLIHVGLEKNNTEGSATSEVVTKGDHSDVNGNEQFVVNGGADSNNKNDSVVIMIGSAIDQQGAVSSPASVAQTEGATGEMAENVVPTEGATGLLVENVVPTQSVDGEMDCGAAGAQNSESVEKAELEETSEETLEKEPLSASAQMPENVRYVKKSGSKKGQNQPGNKSVDFAPEFANQLVATAVNAAGQAYITAKAVFKTWQDKQQEAKDKQQQQQTKGARQKTPPTGWKPASTQYTPPKEEEEGFKPPKSEWKPKTQDWKPPVDTYEPPKSTWKPPVESEVGPPKSQWTPPKDKDTKPEPPKTKWTGPPKEDGPMGRLFEMGFFDRELNRKLLNEYEDDLGKVIQELLSMKNKDWHK